MTNFTTNTYEMKRLNDNDEVENIAIFKDTIFMGEDRLQIKKLDGTIEKFSTRPRLPFEQAILSKMQISNLFRHPRAKKVKKT